MNWTIPDRPADREIVIDGIPPSKKNGQRILCRGRRRFVKSSEAAEAFEERLRLLTGRWRSLGSNYIAARITVDEERQRTLIEIWDLGPSPKRGRKNTRRDIHNVADAVMDALQGIAFDDDRQSRFTLTVHGEVS